MEIFEQINTSVKFRKVWAMPDQWTFKIQPIREIIYKYVGDGKGWLDPFAGENSPAEMTNDLNPNRPTTFHLDALEFLMQQQKDSYLYNGILFDPPYSFTQAKECYDSFGKDLFVEHENKPTMMDYWANCKKVAASKIKVGGIAICCGWNSNGFGKGNGFEMLEVLLVAHGGSKNDTIVTVERKFQSSLF
jgi:hypothetical protein